MLLVLHLIPLSIRIDIRLRELARADSLGKKDIELLVRPPTRLRQTEVRPQSHERGGAGPEEPGLALPVPGLRIEHVRDQDLRRDVDDLVCVAGQHDGVGSETHGADLADDTVGDGADCDGVGEDPQQGDGSLCPEPGSLVCAGRDGADGDEQDAGRALAEEVDCPPSDSSGDEPGADGADEGEGRASKTYGEGFACGDARGGEEVSG